MQFVKELTDGTGLRKVEIFRRADGSFGFSAQAFSQHSLEQSWAPSGRFSECYADTAELAESEARARVVWLRQGAGDRP